MPILDIEVVGLSGDASTLSQALADRIGRVLNSSPGKTWIRLRNLESSHYAENEAPSAPQPVFVQVLEAQPPEDSELRAVIMSLTQTIADVLDRPKENVHILMEPPAQGRISFGGKLRE